MYIIKFETDLCIPCQEVTEILDDLSDEYEFTINAIDVKDTDEDERETKKEYAEYIDTVPTLLFFDNKEDDKPVKVITGSERSEIEKALSEQ